MRKFIDLTGKRFGKLIVISKTENFYRRWDCRCDCGTIKSILTPALVSGDTISCGCHRKAIHTIHGQCVNKVQTGAWKSWNCMIRRCSDPKDTSYQFYGGKSILVCEKWKSFEGFYEDMGDRPPRCSIDRINAKGNYEPSNCRWATSKEQANNTTKNFTITFRGDTKTIQQWSDTTGISRSKIQARIQRLGWDAEATLMKP